MRLTNPNYYTARTTTYAAGSQVAAAALNAIQDGIIGSNTAIDLLVVELAAQGLECQTCTGNQADSPAPDVGGAKTIWVEKSTNGTTDVVLDNSVDWRDRYIICIGRPSASTFIAGGANDNTLVDAMEDGTADAFHRIFYSRDGQTGSSDQEAMVIDLTDAGYTDNIRVFARASDGFLCMKKDANANADVYVVGEFRASPVQNHY